MKKIFISGFLFMVLMAMLLVTSCKDDFGEVNKGVTKYTGGNGLFVVNEGNFGQGNGSVSFINPDSLYVENEIFRAANDRPLGDVAYSMQIIGDEAWVVVNNSARIEVLNLKDLSSVATIDGFESPRFILPVNDRKAYVSDFSATALSIINLQDYSVTGSIPLGHSSENIIETSGKVFVTFWSNYGFEGQMNNRVMVIDPDLDLVTDSIGVGREPNSMVVDNQGMLWVLCSGGFMGDELPSLWRIDPANNGVVANFQFPELNSSPNSLCINGSGDTLFFLNQGVYRMPANAAQLPAEPLITETEHLFYTLAVQPATSHIYTSDAIDYQQRGLVLHYLPDGSFQNSFRAGIIPGKLVFN